MGRGVETVGECPIYFDAGVLEQKDWNDLVRDIQHTLAHKYPSLVAVRDKWCREGREQRLILKNQYCQVSISEYCGCGAVSVFVPGNAEQPAMAENWVALTHKGMVKLLAKKCGLKVLNCIGGFSNGGSVYELAKL